MVAYSAPAGQEQDRYFVGRVAVERRPLAEVAAMHASDRILETRWWTLAELDATDQSIYPKGLAALIRRLTMRPMTIPPMGIHKTEVHDPVNFSCYASEKSSR